WRGGRGLWFFGSALARGGSAASNGGVFTKPLQARGALPARAGRRAPGHEPRAVGARVAAGPELGRGAWRGGRFAAAVDLRRRRSEAVDLRLSRRGGRGPERGRGGRRGPAAGWAAAAGDLGRLSGRVGAPGVRQRPVGRHRDD